MSNWIRSSVVGRLQNPASNWVWTQLRKLRTGLPRVVEDSAPLAPWHPWHLGTLAPLAPGTVHRTWHPGTCCQLHFHPDRAADPCPAEPAITIRILRQVLLVVILRVVELGRGQDFGRDRAEAAL